MVGSRIGGSVDGPASPSCGCFQGLTGRDRDDGTFWPRCLPQAAMVAEQVAFQCLSNVLIEMEAVCNLGRLGCTKPCPFRVGSGSVPADHLDLGMLGQPDDQCLRCTVWQQDR